MIITVDGKEYKHKFDRDKTYEIVCYLFILNYKQTGLYQICINELFILLFIIDIHCLQEAHCVETGNDYYFDSEGDLRASIYYDLYWDESYWGLFTIYRNSFNKEIVKCIDINIVGGLFLGHLSDYLEEVITKVYRNHMSNNYINLINKWFETDERTPFSIPLSKKQITLDYMINKLNLSNHKEDIIEMLSLHNV